MLEIKSENQKLRDQIPMTDKELYYFLLALQIPFDVSPGRAPWLTHERLKWVLTQIEEFEG